MARHRILLSLNDETHSLLKELSELTGVPVATFIAQLIKKNTPHLHVVVAAIAKGELTGQRYRSLSRMETAFEEITAIPGCECDDYNGHKCLMCKVRSIARGALGA